MAHLTTFHVRCALGSLLAAVWVVASANEEGLRPIADNSFLVEEAFNQENGVVHQMSYFMRDRASGDWIGNFTQEWPVVNEDHQFSYTLQGARTSVGQKAATGFGDVLLNYRYQLLADDHGLSFTPRLTAIVPAGDSSRALGGGGWGGQVNLPFSLELGRWFISHTNLGGTWIPDGRLRGVAASTEAFNLGEGLDYRLFPRFNLLVETVWTRTTLRSPGSVTRTDVFEVSPGFRTAFDFRSGLQIVTGLAVPIGVRPSRGATALLVYLSFELPYNAIGKLNAPGDRPRLPVAENQTKDAPGESRTASVASPQP